MVSERVSSVWVHQNPVRSHVSGLGSEVCVADTHESGPRQTVRNPKRAPVSAGVNVFTSNIASV